METTDLYQEFTEKLKVILPIKAYPIREFISFLREKGLPLAYDTEFTILEVMNSGDLLGIMCVAQYDEQSVIVCALTQLIISSSCTMCGEITEYQKNREERIIKLNQIKAN